MTVDREDLIRPGHFLTRANVIQFSFMVALTPRRFRVPAKALHDRSRVLTGDRRKKRWTERGKGARGKKGVRGV
jgi:hypothetical protein